jgi:hypothetical protein
MVSGLFAFLLARGDMAANLAPRRRSAPLGAVPFWSAMSGLPSVLQWSEVAWVVLRLRVLGATKRNHSTMGG